MAQKPRHSGDFVENWLQHELGLVDTKQSLMASFRNLMH